MLPGLRRASEGVECVTGEAPVAFCYGGFRPSIVVSAGLVCELSPDELVAVLAHEQHHLRRGEDQLVVEGRLARCQREPAVQVLREGFDAFLLVAPVLPFSIAVAERCANIRETLQQQGKRTRNRYLDLITAATAIEYDLTLASRNLEHYRDVPGLKLL